MDPLKELLKENVGALNSRTAKIESELSDNLEKINQLLAVLSSAFSSFETKAGQPREHLQQNSSSQTNQSEPVEIQAAKIQAKAINHQAFIMVLTLVVAFLALIIGLLGLLLQYDKQKETENEKLLFEGETKEQKELLREKISNEEKLIEDNEALNDEVSSLKKEKEELEYTIQHSWFFYKQKPPLLSSNKTGKNSGTITPSIRK